MANICTNIMFLSSKNSGLIKSITKKMEDMFSCDNVNHNEKDSFCEMNFDSRWTFPSDEMEKLTATLSNADDLYMRVLSYEFGIDYVAYHIYTSGEWCDKLSDR